jgi:hypothetical protein
MKHLFLGLALAFGLALAAPASDVAAGGESGSSASGSASSGQGARGVPELDTTIAGSAMVLLLGGVAYLASRRRKDAEP